MKIQAAFRTDVGLKRAQNQDCGLSRPELGLFVVADGMGGHRGGEIASSMAIETVQNHLQHVLKKKKWDPTTAISEALEHANDEIYAQASKDSRLEGMGTTTTALLIHGGALTVGHVGDSRCYYLRPGAIWQITRDHSVVQEKLRAGLISRDQLRADRMKNVITRSVGFEPAVQVDIYGMEVQRGDVFLACSDGLSGLVDDETILKIIEKEFFEGDNIERAAEKLIEAANNRGGEDNITAIVVQVVDC